MSQEAKILSAIAVATVAILVGAVFMLGNTPPKPSADPNILVKPDSHKIASDSAKVTVVEFGDFQCPACGQAHPIVKQVLADFNGKINFVFRNFPLPQHQNGLVAAEAAEAAGAQGKYWEMYNKLYENQDSWSPSPNALDVFTSYAKDLGLDVNKFQDEVKNNKYSQIISRDQSDGNTLGVNSTPTFYINGQKLEGIPTYAEFKSRIESSN